ncbi:hypothetical protein [Marinivivus vitaminiproducens]|uniref:hypothetical protein n=1 Tax=Marinivivus vitaminiproducens TaxID=3035935 RepID=UPI00279E784B|nr:hypothetical protein P4R82_02350 [Geminicoccaceae bacterium SCSIO 64248]
MVDQPLQPDLEKDPHAAFLLSQFETLSAEKSAHAGRIRAIERETLIGLAAFYSWMFTSAPGTLGGLYQTAFFIPVLFVLLNWFLVRAYRRQILEISAYHADLETYLAGFARMSPVITERRDRKVHGWEGFRITSDPSAFLFRKSFVLFWSVTAVVVVLIPAWRAVRSWLF